MFAGRFVSPRNIILHHYNQRAFIPVNLLSLLPCPTSNSRVSLLVLATPPPDMLQVLAPSTSLNQLQTIKTFPSLLPSISQRTKPPAPLLRVKLSAHLPSSMTKSEITQLPQVATVPAASTKAAERKTPFLAIRRLQREVARKDVSGMDSSCKFEVCDPSFAVS